MKAHISRAGKSFVVTGRTVRTVCSKQSPSISKIIMQIIVCRNAVSRNWFSLFRLRLFFPRESFYHRFSFSQPEKASNDELCLQRSRIKFRSFFYFFFLAVYNMQNDFFSVFFSRRLKWFQGIYGVSKNNK